MANKPAQPDPASGADAAAKGAAANADTSAAAQADQPVSGGQARSAGGQAAQGAAAGRGGGATALLKQVLDGYLTTAGLQADCQALYRALPVVVGIASEIMKKKEAGDAAMQEGLAAVERVLGDARDKAEQLSKAMTAQQSALEALLQDKASLTDLLKASQQIPSSNLKGVPNLGSEAAILADPKVAYQLNTLMGNINSMVSREVERQLSSLMTKAASKPGGAPQK